MKILNRLICTTTILSIILGSVTGVFAANSGREETREYTLNGLSLKVSLFGSEISNFVAPFDIGSAIVKYENCSFSNKSAVYLTVDSEVMVEGSFKSGSGEAELVSHKTNGIKKGSKIRIRSASGLSATVTSITFRKENSPGIDWYSVDVPPSGISIGTSKTSIETAYPFNVGSVEFSYTNSGSSNLTLNVEVNGSASTVSLPSGTGNARAYFESAVVPSNSTLNLNVRSGSVNITGIKLHKENKIWPEQINQEIEYTDYEAALQTATVFKSGAYVYKNKNAIRYLSYENTKSQAFYVNETFWVPVKAMALAFSLYLEDTGTSYLLRDANHRAEDYIISKDACVKNASGDDCYILHYVTNHFGYGLSSSSDGTYAVVDKYTARAKEIVENEVIFNNLISEFGSYESEEIVGNTYYVSDGVQKSGDGSEYSPFKTIQEAANRASAGDRVIIKGGTYRETVIPQNSGTAKNPIIFEAASGEQVTVSAFEEIKNFKLYHDGVYVAVLPKKLDFGSDLILHKGQALREGRQPDSNTSGLVYPQVVTSPLWPTKGDITTPASTFIARSGSGLSNGRDNALVGATYVAFKGAAWGNAFGKVVSSTTGSVSVRDISKMNYYTNSRTGDWGYITNSKMTLNQPGEWYVCDRVLYIVPPSGTDAEDLKVEAKQRYLTFDLTDKSNILIKNINTSGGAVLMGGDSKLNVLYGGTHKYTSHFSYPLDETGVFYENLTSPNNPVITGKSGSYVAGIGNAVVNAKFDTGAGAGLILGGKYGYVSGNTILDTGYGGLVSLSGILVVSSSEEGTAKAGGHNIHYNTVSKTGRSALVFNARYIGNDESNQKIPFIPIEVSYNDFSYSNILARDTGVIYLHGCMMGNDLVKTEIHHNMLSNSVFTGEYDGVSLSGAYADNYTGNGVFHNNIVYYEDDFVYDKNSYSNDNLVGDELYIKDGVHIQDWGVWRRKYSTFESYNNMDGKGEELQHASGFDKTNPKNYPDGKIFKCGA